MNKLAKFIGFILIQLLYSIGIYAVSFILTGTALTGLFMAFQIIKGGFPDVILWKTWLLASLPCWLVLEIIVNVNVYRLLKGKPIK